MYSCHGDYIHTHTQRTAADVMTMTCTALTSYGPNVSKFKLNTDFTYQVSFLSFKLPFCYKFLIV